MCRSTVSVSILFSSSCNLALDLLSFNDLNHGFGWRFSRKRWSTRARWGSPGLDCRPGPVEQMLRVGRGNQRFGNDAADSTRPVEYPDVDYRLDHGSGRHNGWTCV